MNLKYLISAIGILILTSCSTSEHEGSDIYAILKGTVTDDSGSPIEHIEVSVELSRKSTKTYYTSSDGKFICDITYKESKNLKDIRITLTDTDGDENGGLFDTINEEIHLYDEVSNIPMILDLDFHCSHANL